jgi:site-specific DNA-methyltransferase (adenine-specific)
MADTGLFNNVYNPDVLSCLANLSNDEVFTPPDVVNDMLDMLPQELFQNPDTTFLDPACKTGVFLREIAKRLIVGLEPQIPDLQERVDHILKHQLYGIAITELTSLLSRRSVYCSKYPNSEFSVTRFDNTEGIIRFRKIQHTWKNGNCVFCGISKKTELGRDERGDTLEAHAYEWIHTLKPEEIFNMKFDVIISNPPYQLETEGAGKQAKPIYHLFVEQAKKLNPRFLTMIIPSRWFSGGMGLDSFRDMMMQDTHITKLVDFANAKDCFPQNSISGGVCFFLRERDRTGDCEFTNIRNNSVNTVIRALNEFPVIVRYNEAVSIIHKVTAKNEEKLEKIISSLMPYGLSTNYRGKSIKSQPDDLILHSSQGITYISPTEINKGFDSVYKYKILISKTGSEHAGEPGKDGSFKVLTSSLKVIGPGEVCTHSYFIIGCFDEQKIAENTLSYLRTKFVRFLILQSMSSINLSKLVFSFVPMQDFLKSWTDEKLYIKYGLNQDEIDFIESMIKPMDLDGGDDSGK